MNIIFYIATVFVAIFCVNTAIRMDLRTNLPYTCFLLMFFGSTIGAAVYVFYNGVHFLYAMLLVSACGLLYSNRRKAFEPFRQLEKAVN